MKSIVLASASPRRKELLKDFFKLKIQPADIDESRRGSESPRVYVKRMAKEKWQKAAKSQKTRAIVVAADTSVIQGRTIFGKASNAREAVQILKKLSGKAHYVLSSVAVGWSDREHPQYLVVVSTRVDFRKLTFFELQSYIRGDEWNGKAGAYGIQGSASKFVSKIRGSITNVVGLPLEATIPLIVQTFSHPLPRK